MCHRKPIAPHHNIASTSQIALQSNRQQLNSTDNKNQPSTTHIMVHNRNEKKPSLHEKKSPAVYKKKTDAQKHFSTADYNFMNCDV
jgi:hypothetical protein